MFQDLLLGKKVNVMSSTNSSLVGLNGLIVCESQNTIRVLTEKKETKLLLKSICTLKINDKVVSGNEILARPYERLKQKWKRK